MKRLRHDLVLSIRTLRANLGFAATATLTLGVGIGMSVAMFTIVRTVLLDRLPVRDQDRVVTLRVIRAGVGEIDPDLGFVEQFTQSSRTLSDVAGVGHWGSAPIQLLDASGRPVTVNAALVTGNFFNLLGARPALGRLFRAEDDVKGAEPVMVLSYAAWQRQFGGDSGILGRRMRWPTSAATGESPYRIIGVAPPGLDYPAGTDDWMPIVPVTGTGGLVVAVGRLAPSATLDAARAEYLSALLARGANHADQIEGRTLTDQVVGDVRPVLYVLTAAVTILLLISWVNVGNLLLLRGTKRGREIAIRRAIGATYGDIVRLLFLESGVLGVMGGVLGLLCAEAALRTVIALAPAQLPRVDAIHLGALPVSVAIVTTILAMLAFGTGPALITARVPDLSSTLRLDARSGGDSGRRRLTRQVLVGVQVTLAVVMLAGAGLLARTLRRLDGLALGYNPERLSMLEISWDGPKTFAKLLPLSDQIARSAGAVPGVVSLSPVLLPPFGGTQVWLSPFEAEHVAAATSDTISRFPVEVAGPDYFTTLGIPLVEGRGFSDGDGAGDPLVVVVSEAVAHHLWPGQDALGKRVRLPHWDSSFRGDSSWRTVVGVVGDTHFRAMRESAPTVYFPVQQSIWQGVVAVRTGVPLATVVPGLRRAIHTVDPGLSVWRARTMDEFLGEPLATPRLMAFLVSAFGLVALALAIVGLYGAMAFVVREQRHEIGVRMALGAPPDVIGRRFLGQAFTILAPGAAVGLVCALGVSRLMRALLFQVSPGDPVALLGACAVLLLAGLLAAYVPARYAARIDPASTLRDG